MRTILLACFATLLVAVIVGGLPGLAQEPATVRDPVERAAYENAIAEAPADAKAAALEDFLAKYPESVVRTQALNALLGSYQQRNDRAKMMQTAARLLDADPKNLRGAFAYVFLAKNQATAWALGGTPMGGTFELPSLAAGALHNPGGAAPFHAAGAGPFNAAGAVPRNAAGAAPTNATGPGLANAAARAPRNSSGPAPGNAAGRTPWMPNSPEEMFDAAANVARAALKVTAPTPGSGVSHEEFAKLKTATTPIFLSAIATDEVVHKNYDEAIGYYQAELTSYPDLGAPAGLPGINETYLLGQAYLQLDPKDLPNGIFYLARAASYAPANAKDQIEKAAAYWYRKYHGGMDGFDAVKELARDHATPPDAYRPVAAPPPPPAETLAHAAVVQAEKNPDGLKSLALGDKEFILAYGSQEDAEKVWAVMKGVRVEVPGIVIAATANSVQLAVSDDAQQAKQSDFTINFAAPSMNAPSTGSWARFYATFESYTAKPFLCILREGAAVQLERKIPVRHSFTAQSAPNGN